MNLTGLLDDCFGGGWSYNHFNDIDTVTFCLVSILLLIVYSRNKNKTYSEEVSTSNIENESLDILLQPKKEMAINSERLPFSQFSAKTVYFILGIIALLVSVRF